MVNRLSQQKEFVRSLEPTDPYDKARVEMLMGNTEQAIDWIEEATQSDWDTSMLMKTDPCFTDIIEHP